MNGNAKVNYYPYHSTPTLHDAPNFDPLADAHVLKKAMRGMGTDHNAIIDILCKRGVLQRVQIAEQFKIHYGMDLSSALKKELTGDFERVMVTLTKSLPEVFATELNNSIKGLGTNEDAIIEILCSLSNKAISIITEEYQKLYGKSLESDLKHDTSGHFKRLLVSLLQAKRDESSNVDLDAAKADANSILKAGETISGTEESVFHNILVTRSYPHLKQVFQDYRIISKKDIEDTIKDEFSGEIQRGLLAIVKCVKDKVGFFAERLYVSMKGLGTKDKTLTRIIVTRSEIDLGDIKKAFQDRYGKTLQSWISDDTTGHYRRALLTLVG